MDLPAEKTIPLRKPLATRDGEVNELHLREPTADELDRFSVAVGKKGGVGATIDLIAAVTGIDRPFVARLPARDFHAASDYLGGFMNGSPKDGETSSPT